MVPDFDNCFSTFWIHTTVSFFGSTGGGGSGGRGCCDNSHFLANLVLIWRLKSMIRQRSVQHY